MADSDDAKVEGFLMRKLWHDYLSFPLSILGAVATVLAIIQGISFLFLEKKAISAVYKFEVLAQDGSAFNARTILDPNLSDWKKIVQVDVIIWNSGNEPIEHKDVRRDTTISLDSSSKVIDVHTGIQKSNKPDDFKFQDSGMNSYKLTWDVLDPGDFFETHFLVGTNLDRESIKQIVQVEGLISGNTRVGFHQLSALNGIRVSAIFLVGSPLTLLFFVSIGLWTNKNKRVKAFFDSLKPQYSAFLAAIILFFSGGFAFFATYLVVFYLWYVHGMFQRGQSPAFQCSSMVRA
jgi:hypothetical protein